MSQLKTASVLAFERNFDISDGFFSQKDSQNSSAAESPIPVREKAVRGTISNRLKAKVEDDPAKLNAEIEKANLQRVDVATLDQDKDTLIAKWSLKILPFTGEPNVCNDQTYQEKLQNVIQSYLNNHGLTELSRRYAINIANARWLWRNRIGSEQVTVQVTCQLENEENINLTFNNAKNYSLNDMDISDEQIEKLASLIEKGLIGQAFVVLYIRAEAQVGYGQEVYPSQELVLDTGNQNGKKSKVLYAINNTAGIHSQKLGNAIRTIDDWYADDAAFPIAVEPYGAVTTMGHAFRQPKDKQSFYKIFDPWVLKDETPLVEQQHYAIAVLIRGGVFGESGKE